MLNPFDLDATGLLIWGIVAHLIADWPLQNDWMANNKAKRRVSYNWYPVQDPTTNHWYDRHPAAYVHAGIHGLLLAVVFGWVAVILALVHLVIDCRWIVVKWSQLIKQTQPEGRFVYLMTFDERGFCEHTDQKRPLYDVGTEVRFWTDQVFHIATIAVTALLVTL